MSDEDIRSITIYNYIITPKLSYFGTKVRVKSKGSCLEEDTITYTHRKTVNIYIAYEKIENFPISSYLTLENCLFGTVTLTKNFDIDK